MEDTKTVEKSATKEKKTQKTEVLKYLQTHEYITDNIAHDLFGVNRLSDIIFRLRNKGYDIATRSVTKKNRYGNTCTYAEYILIS